MTRSEGVGGGIMGTKEQAINRYLRFNKRAARVVEKIMLWDKTKTLDENSKKLKVPSASGAYQFGRRFGLPFLKTRTKRAIIDVEVAKSLRDKGFSFTRIGNLYGVSRQAVESILRSSSTTASVKQGRSKANVHRV